jgi:hypothetical protein
MFQAFILWGLGWGRYPEGVLLAPIIMTMLGAYVVLSPVIGILGFMVGGVLALTQGKRQHVAEGAA